MPLTALEESLTEMDICLIGGQTKHLPNLKITPNALLINIASLILLVLITRL
jgi:hypothetical protein